MIKICVTCKLEKPLDDFNKDKSTRDGFDCRCRECSKERSRKYRETHKDICRAASKRWAENNKERIKKTSYVYKITHRTEILEKKKIYRQNNKEKIKAYNESHKEQMKVWRERHKKELTVYARLWREINAEKIKDYYKEKRKNDINFSISSNYRRRMSQIIHGKHLSKRMQEIIGCDFETLKNHIEKQFKPGMTWNNYGVSGWQIDHIVPCSAFDMTDEKQLKECFNYKNIQPLWAAENRKKSNKIIKEN